MITLGRTTMRENIEQFGKDEFSRLYVQSEGREGIYREISQNIIDYRYGKTSLGELFESLRIHQAALAGCLVCQDGGEVMGILGDDVMISMSQAVYLRYGYLPYAGLYTQELDDVIRALSNKVYHSAEAEKLFRDEILLLEFKHKNGGEDDEQSRNDGADV